MSKPIHELAIENAISLELKKDGLSQRQSGDWVLRFVVQAADMDQRLTSAAMGTRFQVALVEIGDDELPKQKGKLDWRELQPAAQAGIRANDPVFYSFLNETDRILNKKITGADEAAEIIRNICGVKSRSELGTNHKARILWHQLDEHFQAWKAHENA